MFLLAPKSGLDDTKPDQTHYIPNQIPSILKFFAGKSEILCSQNLRISKRCRSLYLHDAFQSWSKQQYSCKFQNI